MLNRLLRPRHADRAAKGHSADPGGFSLSPGGWDHPNSWGWGEVASAGRLTQGAPRVCGGQSSLCLQVAVASLIHPGRVHLRECGGAA